MRGQALIVLLCTTFGGAGLPPARDGEPQRETGPLHPHDAGELRDSLPGGSGDPGADLCGRPGVWSAQVDRARLRPGAAATGWRGAVAAVDAGILLTPSAHGALNWC